MVLDFKMFGDMADKFKELFTPSYGQCEMDDPRQQGPPMPPRSRNGDCHIDIEPRRKKPSISRTWSIWKVPSHVREVDDTAYTPRVVSIGPFHHHTNKALDAKKRFLDRLLERTKLLEADLLDAMRKLEVETRNCYSEKFDMNSDDFVQMMMLDACFVVEILRLNEKIEEGKEVDEPIFGPCWTVPNIGRDLLLLENQLPMFVLNKVHMLTSSCSWSSSLNKLALKFFKPLRLGRNNMPGRKLDTTDKYEHLLHLLHSSYGPDQDNHSDKTKTTTLKYDGRLPGKGWINNASKLTFAGIELQGKSDGEHQPLDIEFKEKVLKIPTLFLDDGSSPQLRNLIAYEQSNSCVEPYFSSLAIFFDSIVDTAKDINILRNAGIIKQAKGGNHEIVQLFNSLTKELEFAIEDCPIPSQIVDINYCCRSRTARLKIPLRSYFYRLDYFYCMLTLISIGAIIYSLCYHFHGQENE